MRKDVIAKTGKGSNLFINTIKTRELILNKTLELINNNGMVNFRVDALSTTLNLSPGNVTYHFSKKEDLSNALWLEINREFESINILISNLMDIKQTFLVFRTVCNLVYKYRGIIMYRGGDLYINRNDNEGSMSLNDKFREYYRIVFFNLDNNGYIKSDKEIGDRREMIEDNAIILMRYWVNKEYFFCNDNEDDISKLINKNALMVLHSIIPLLNDKGVREYNNIKTRALA